MRHKWGNGNVCLICGVEREMRTVKLLMAIVNHPPWEAYKYERKYFYLVGKELTPMRPDCTPPTSNQ